VPGLKAGLSGNINPGERINHSGNINPGENKPQRDRRERDCYTRWAGGSGTVTHGEQEGGVTPVTHTGAGGRSNLLHTRERGDCYTHGSGETVTHGSRRDIIAHTGAGGTLLHTREQEVHLSYPREQEVHLSYPLGRLEVPLRTP